MILSNNTYNYNIIKHVEELSAFFTAEFQKNNFASFYCYFNGLSFQQPHASNFLVVATCNNKPIALFAITQIVVVNEHIRFKDLNSILRSLLYKIISISKYKINVVGSPYKDNEPTALIIDKTINLNELIEDFLLFTKDDSQLSASLTIWSNSQLDEILKKLNFDTFSNDYSMLLDIHPAWRNMEDYKNALSKKYRVRINKIQAVKEVLSQKRFDIEAIKQNSTELIHLYKQVINNQLITLNIIDLSFFSHLYKTYGANFNFFGYYLNGVLIAFRSTIKQGDIYKTYFIGMNQELNKEYHLYQQILLDSLDDAIALGCKVLDIGRTALEAKAMLGAKPQIQNVYYKASNKIFQWIVFYLLKQFSANLGTDWQKRNPFKV